MKTKRKPIVTLFIILLASVTTLFVFFKNKKHTALFAPEIVDYPHKMTINTLFETADAYKYAQDYKKADAEFQRLLTQPLSVDESQYVLNQLAYISLTMNEDSTAAYWIQLLEKNSTPLSKEALADYNYNKAILAFHFYDIPLADSLLRIALPSYTDIYPTVHLKNADCLTKIGLVQFGFSSNMGA